jgi:hypothetical protein
MRLDVICRSDIIRWRDDCAEGKQAKFNRALPVLAAMLKYAEALGYLRKGSNPCRGRRASSARRWSGFSVRRSIGGLGWR